jgi:hypothetical protein
MHLLFVENGRREICFYERTKITFVRWCIKVIMGCNNVTIFVKIVKIVFKNKFIKYSEIYGSLLDKAYLKHRNEEFRYI